MATFRFQSLDIYRLARDLAVMVQDARIKDAELRDQETRAAKSCFLNLSEGLPSNQAGIRRRHFSLVNGRSQSFRPRLISPSPSDRSKSMPLRPSKPVPSGSP